MEIKSGSRWWASSGEKFVVLGVMTIEGKEWVYYRNDKPINETVREYSCYKESFLARLSPMPE